MYRNLVVSLCSIMMLLTAACTKGRYTDDRHYVGNPERPHATSESTTPEPVPRTPPNTERR